MPDLSFATILGAWVSIFLTLCILSFLYEDNPVYKVAEHLFLGVSIGYGVVEQYYGVFKPNLLQKIVQPAPFLGMELPFRFWSLFPLALLLMLFFKLSRKNAWVARVPIAFLVAAFAGVKLTGEANANLMTQVATSMPDLATSWKEHGLWDWKADGAGVISDFLLVAGLIACLMHFYFGKVPRSVARPALKIGLAIGAVVAVVTMFGLGVTGRASVLAAPLLGLLAGVLAALPLLAVSEHRQHVQKLGIFTLMLSFGASFGYTVMGRISLAIGRAQELLGLDKLPAEVDQIHPVIATLLSSGVIIWLLRRRALAR